MSCPGGVLYFVTPLHGGAYDIHEATNSRSVLVTKSGLKPSESRAKLSSATNNSHRGRPRCQTSAGLTIDGSSRMVFTRIIRSQAPAPARAMSTASIAGLQRMSARALSERMLEEREAADPTFAVIDVRDDDYIGGHIRGSTNVPSLRLDYMLPTLVRRLMDKKTVIFHCALSQQRGPSAALRYLRERDGLLAALGQTSAERQSVYVLDRGFAGWQEVYGEDERLTEGYRKELWLNH
ncbi:Transcriptional adapter 2 [Tolypocladium capitatum]|uniref:Transcriptional adapter 2 n=1 Tax=Tolypocladium capitatum TaxID=45235 RepID=A0A2K3QMM2_9HYPO|nr:Transcriptional adapter 2 [Tolypocladium capitatum]